MTDSIQLQPDDEHNRLLESNVRPLDWQNPTPTGRYHLVVLGAGPAGLVTAVGAAGLGAKVALVERRFLGGDCLNVGCVPSKSMIVSARRAADLRHAGEFGVTVPGEVCVDFSRVMDRMRRLRAGISFHDSAERFRDLGIDVFQGSAAFLNAETVTVDGVPLKFKRAVITTGDRPQVPSVPGLGDVDYLTSESVFSLTKLPAKLGVIGAGPIGCELAQTFARFGSTVCLVESGHGILPRDDAEASAVVQQSLIADGIQLACCARQVNVRQESSGVRLRLHSHGEQYDESLDAILVAAGRVAQIEGLNLDAVDVECDAAGIRVNDQLQTSNPRIYAAGDVCSQFKFTHAADFMARIVIRNALFMGRARMSQLTIPWCTYTSPELAHVGLSPADASQQGVAIDTFTQRLEHVDRAVLESATDGFVRVHVRKGSDKIVGGTIVANNAGEMISEITLAMRNNIGLSKIANTIHPYPTQAEAIRKVGEMYQRTRLTPLVQSLFRWWLGTTK